MKVFFIYLLILIDLYAAVGIKKAPSRKTGGFYSTAIKLKATIKDCPYISQMVKI